MSLFKWLINIIKKPRPSLPSIKDDGTSDDVYDDIISYPSYASIPYSENTVVTTNQLKSPVLTLSNVYPSPYVIKDAIPYGSDSIAQGAQGPILQGPPGSGPGLIDSKISVNPVMLSTISSSGALWFQEPIKPSPPLITTPAIIKEAIKPTTRMWLHEQPSSPNIGDMFMSSEGAVKVFSNHNDGEWVTLCEHVSKETREAIIEECIKSRKLPFGHQEVRKIEI